MKHKILVLSTLSIMLLGASLFSTRFVEPDTVDEVSATSVIDTYYANANASSKDNLYNSLNSIINTGYVKCSYDSLEEKLRDTDYDAQGLDDPNRPNRMVDMYSNITNYEKNDDGGSYKKEGDCWNKEHLICKSWWGDSKSGPNNEGGDAFNMYPTDGKINGMRSSYALGEVDTIKTASNDNFSKLGPSKSDNGYSGTVFEPNDKYKGDIARAYFYFATKHNKASTYQSGDGKVMFSTSTKYVLSNYAAELFYKWHKLDPVSAWERQRCDNIYNIQKNRNPYIDHPEWVDFIWGDGTIDPIDEVLVTGITLSSNKLTIAEESSQRIKATVSPISATNQTVVWSSDDESIATVDDGLITAVGQGTCNIICSATDGSGVSSTCEVTVTEKGTVIIENTKISITKAIYSNVSSYAWYDWKDNTNATKLGKMYCFGSEDYLQFNSSKTGKGLFSNVEKFGLKSVKIDLTTGGNDVTWTLRASKTAFDSSNHNSGGEIVGSAKVLKGTSGTITPNKNIDDYGYFSLYISSDGYCRVNEIELTYGSGDDKPEPVSVSSVSLSKNELDLELGDYETLTATVLPANADDKTVRWESDDTSVATVVDGYVTGLKVGTASISVITNDGNKTDTCLVVVSDSSPVVINVTSISLNVTSITVDQGNTSTLVATIGPENATDKTVTWSSTDSTICTVNNGIVAAIKDGDCVISASANGGTNIIATCNVHVNKVEENPVVNPEPEQPQPTNNSGCSGSLIATSAILSTISMIGASLLIIKKKQK